MIQALALLLALSPAEGPNAVPQEPGFQLPVEEHVLDNGMRILIIPRRQVPRVYCSLWWRVGSVNERAGVTGLSHFFEHMMFMGTDVIGTVDRKRDAELNAKIERTMSRIRALKLRRLEDRRRGLEPSEKVKKRYDRLWKKYQEYVGEQKRITVPEHLSKIYQANGGTRLNATTSYDRTNYFVELPANKTELFFWLESDRFNKPVFRSFYPEREVVKEERRMRTDSTPTGLIDEAYLASFWQSHPYRWPVIGWMSDIDQYTLTDAEAYFKTHYSPENCTAMFVGDVDADAIKALAKRYFGRLKRFPGERPAIVTQESRQVAVKRMHAEADTPSRITIRWHGPSGVHKDSAALDLLMNVFSGRSGRLFRPLVMEKKLALNVEGWYWSLRYGGIINLGAVLREGVDFGDAEKAFEEVIDDVRKNGVSEREVKKAKNKMLADLVRTLQTARGITQQLGYFETIGTHKDFRQYAANLQAATGGDLKRLANEYLVPQGRNILTIRRKEKK